MKIISSLLIALTVSIIILSSGSQAAIFSGVDVAGKDYRYGVCINPTSTENEEYCSDVDCTSDSDKNDPRCISETEAGTGLGKTSLSETGITHTDSLAVLIVKYVNFVLPYLTLAAFVGFVVAGFFYVTAYGNEEQLQKAKKILIWSVVGLILVIMSFTIVNLLTGEDKSSLLQGLQELPAGE